jgi:crossover junction endodeoxyribonuclease RuvC
VNTRIIGVDPGSRFTGYGIIDSDHQNLQLIEAGCIRLPDQPFSQRLKCLFDEISAVCQQYKPQCAAVENIFYARNVRSALQLGQTRGVILLGLVNENCRIYEYSALQVKNAITGYGRAEKSQLKKMVEMMLHADFANSKFDLTDALGLAITHAHVSSFQNRLVPENRSGVVR